MPNAYWPTRSAISTSSAPTSAGGHQQRPARSDDPGGDRPGRNATKAIGPAAAVANAISPTAATMATQPRALDADAERDGGVVAEPQQRQVARLAEQHGDADHDGDGERHDLVPGGAVEAAGQPAHRGLQVPAGRPATMT